MDTPCKPTTFKDMHILWSKKVWDTIDKEDITPRTLFKEELRIRRLIKAYNKYMINYQP